MKINHILWKDYAPLCLKCNEEVQPNDYKMFYLNNKNGTSVYFHKACVPKSKKEFLEFNIIYERAG